MRTRLQVGDKFENTHKRKDGSEFIAEVTLNYFEIEEKEYLFAYIFDVTERKKLEEDYADYTPLFVSAISGEWIDELKKYIMRVRG